MFEDSLVESRISGAKKTATVAISALAHVAVVAVLIIVPLLVTDALPAGGGTGLGGILLAPGWGAAPEVAPPPPAGGTAARASQPDSRSADAVELTTQDVSVDAPVIDESVLVANRTVVLPTANPRAVPQRMAALSGVGESGGVDGGEHGGLEGGQIGGRGNRIDGILGGVMGGPGCGILGCGTGGFGPGIGPGGSTLGPATAPPPAPVTRVATPPPPPPVNIPAPPKVIRVAGEVQLANCIRCPAPEYPALARISRVSDTVVLSARINKQGLIENLTVVRGHILLQDAAKNAVREWRYRPTIVSGEPAEVQTTISIVFVFK